MLRKSVGKIASSLPLAKSYLDEKRQMDQKIQTLQKHIKNLEENERTQHGRLFSFSDVKPHIRFISNQLDATGAPLIFIDILMEFKKVYPKTPVTLNTFRPIDNHYLKKVQSLGVNVVVHERTDVEIEFTNDDIVVLNTAAHSLELKSSLYTALETGTLNKLIWYIQEDWPETFFNDKEKQRIHALLSSGKIIIYNPARQATENLQKYFADKENIRLQPYRLKIPPKYHKLRQAVDFKKLTFVMVGKTGGGIKGHMPVLYAFLSFKKFYYDKHPDAYRDFELRLIAIENDLLSKQIKDHSSELKGHFRDYPPLAHDGALEVIMESNITICYSMRECLPIFVFEGMAAGHPILRNEVSGLEEQLENGKNGFLLRKDSYLQVLDTVERILNKQKTEDKQLASMSKRSTEIASEFEAKSYDAIIKAIHESLSHSDNIKSMSNKKSLDA